ncbi:MAG: hypothetical protein NZM26_00490 [Patescibacteria group bacterium]|nr:hypothetical protein [Patescibacteria group bacterium]
MSEVFVPRENILDDLLKVGEDKPLGYLEVGYMRLALNAIDTSIWDFFRKLDANGKKVKVFPPRYRDNLVLEKIWIELPRYREEFGPLQDMQVLPGCVAEIYTSDIDRFEGVRNFLESFTSLSIEEILSPDSELAEFQSVYVYDPESLAKLLKENEHLLRNYGWPTNPNEFVNYVYLIHADQKTPLFDLIANAFGDKSNPGRTDVEGDYVEDDE